MKKPSLYSSRWEYLIYVAAACLLVGSGLVSPQAAVVMTLSGIAYLIAQSLDTTPTGRYSASIGVIAVSIAFPIFISTLMAPEYRKPLTEIRFWSFLLGGCIFAFALNWFLPAFFVTKERLSFRSEQKDAGRNIEKLSAEWGEILDQPFQEREKY